uniref:Uncharacterized protein n=1 Tax=Timspurckia oligopyrenoides TaxID=708627 RepID=A0A7S0ZDD5_9RHOD|mmetsp:Transcript_13388/g.24020  ORF Transcript_13388/g.24020 Transcript_13388/m.24020 type:complete len:255 (+) Transcript_13388:75-839(+)
MAAGLSIGLLLGKADATFRAVGGSSIVAGFLRSVLTGKTYRVIEYPDGNLKTFKLRINSLSRLKSLIADAQPPPYPTLYLTAKDIQQVVLFTPPFFTEPILSDSDLRKVPDGSWLIWSPLSPETDPIPQRGYKLDYVAAPKGTGSEKDEKLTSRNSMELSIANAILRLKKAQQDTSDALNREQFDQLVDLLVDGDLGLVSLSQSFENDPDQFIYHSRRLLKRRQNKNTIVENNAIGNQNQNGTQYERTASNSTV